MLFRIMLLAERNPRHFLDSTNRWMTGFACRTQRAFPLKWFMTFMWRAVSA